EWAAAVAAINRGISLQVVRDGVADLLKQFASTFAADHTVGKCVIEPEWRTDRKGKLPNSYSVAVAELDDRQIFGIDLDHGDIGFFIGAHHPRRKIPSVSQLHIDLVCAFDHVKVREDVA